MVLDNIDNVTRNEILNGGSNKVRLLFSDEGICGLCSLFGSIVIAYIRFGAPMHTVIDFATALCFIFLYSSRDVCRGMLEEQEVGTITCSKNRILVAIYMQIRNSKIFSKL